MSIRITPPQTSFSPFAPLQAGERRNHLPRPAITLPKLPPLSREPNSLGTGLTTPPVDDMSAMYQSGLQQHHPTSYHGLPANTQSLDYNTRSNAAAASRAAQYHRHAAPVSVQSAADYLSLQPAPYQPQPPVLGSLVEQQQHQQQSLSVPPTTAFPNQYYSKQPTAHAGTNLLDVPGSTQSEPVDPRNGSESLIHHSLHIPRCISLNGGSLSEFAARMTCLFWFESVDELKFAETIGSRSPLAAIPSLPNLAKPHEAFLKWTHGVLSTTQVTQNVVLLALMFIYRLKMSTPRIKGRGGSEYRLLTVALMLGNKFLDDNTYTNKTWAEVSCFDVKEIHVMEVEFLNNLRYNLLASKDQWDEWLSKLANFHEYYDRALALPVSPIMPTAATSSPLGSTRFSPRSSPLGASLPFSNKAASATPTAPSRLSPISGNHQNWPPYSQDPISPLEMKLSNENTLLSRKRNAEDEFMEHPAKRPTPQQPRLMGHRPLGSTKLPVPQLSVVTQPTPPPTGSTPAYHPPQSTSGDMISLPPLQPGVRAMSTVYQPSPAANFPTLPATSMPGSAVPSAYSVPSVSNQPMMGHHTPTRVPSPTSLAPPYMTSQMGDLGPGSAVGTPIGHTPMSMSPSVYLQQRYSPYRPIRHVHTLGSSASLDQYHFQVPVQPTQMHYQPLGRRHDVRSGVVPEFLLYNRQPHSILPQARMNPYGP